MRVISGKFRGKKLNSPQGGRVRPTSDRVKETLFNILYSLDVYDGIAVLDLFAGTGSLGIEALSRGASSCVFVDIDRESCAFVKDNLKTAGTNAEIYHADYKTAIHKLAGRKFDLILIDPPYKRDNFGEIVNLILQHEILNKSGVIVIEHDKKAKPAGLPEALVQDIRPCGNTALTFLKQEDK